MFSYLMLYLFLSLSPALSLRVSYFQELTIGSKECKVLDYGCVGDGEHDDTSCIQSAIDTCGHAGGGKVEIPEGKTFLIKSLNLSYSHLELNIMGTLLVSNDRKHWPGEHHIIEASGVTNIAITGSGMINGQGLVWWQHREDFRPHTVDFRDVKHALLSGVVFKDPPNHCLELFADFTELAGVSVYAPPSTGIDNPSHNTDAVDVHGTPFYIHDCYFDTGDDNIAAHANHTLVENSYFGNGHGASIGSLCSTVLTNITFRNLTFNGTTSGARIKVTEGCSGRLSNVVYQGLHMTGVGTPLDVSMHYSSLKSAEKARDGLDLTAHTGFTIDGVTFQDIYSTNQHYDGSFICTDDSPCKNIILKNITFDDKSSTEEWTCHNAKGCDCFVGTSGKANTVSPDPSSCL